MPVMTHRTTFALDETTANRLRRLAARWQVSQAEVVRRSLEKAEALTGNKQSEAARLLQQLHEAGGGLDLKKADAYLKETYQTRKQWRSQ